MELHSGELIAADYWSDKSLIPSAGMGFEGIIRLPEVNEETVRDAGGSLHKSATCTNGEEPVVGSYTSAFESDATAILYKGFSDTII
ncbi:MAG: hypothetical protein AAFV33_25715 [Chloroflexota bacterium]